MAQLEMEAVHWINVGTSLPLLALGMWALTHRHRPEARIFGSFLVGFGGHFATLNVVVSLGAIRDGILVLSTLLALLAVVAAGWLVARQSRIHRDRSWAMLAGGAAMACMIGAQLWHDKHGGFLDNELRWSVLASLLASYGLVSALAGLLMVWACWAIYSPMDVKKLALASAGVAVYPAVRASAAVMSHNQDGVEFLVMPAVFVAAVVLPAFLWVARTGRGLEYRNTAWWMLSCLAGGAVLWLLLEPLEHGLARSWQGISRFAGAGVLAYGILRQDILGVDRQARWAIRGGFVAAVFLAVVYAATEGMQHVQGDRNPAIGIAAGAVLMFLLAPLQRWADRLALRAVPIERGAQDVYRDAVRYTLSDRVTSEREERHLGALAERLGLGALAAAEIGIAVRKELGIT